MERLAFGSEVIQNNVQLLYFLKKAGTTFNSDLLIRHLRGLLIKAIPSITQTKQSIIGRISYLTIQQKCQHTKEIESFSEEPGT